MSTDRRAYENEWLNQPGPSTGLPLNDPLQSAHIRTFSPDTGNRTKSPIGLYFGVVIEGFSYLNSYRVTVEGGSVIQCSAGSHHSNLPMGTSSSVVYGPGQEVIVLLRNNASTGVIICAVPREVANPNDFRPDAMFSGSNTGYFVDPTCNFWTGLSTNDISDFSAGRTYDITCIPQEVVQGVTGVGYFVTDYMVGVKVDEETGLFCFYDDSMARLTGRNLQIRAHGLEQEWLNDDGELSGYSGRTPYPWENLGAYRLGVKTSNHIIDDQAAFQGIPDEEEPPEDDPEEDPEDLDDGDDGEEEETPTATVTADTPELAGVRYGFVQPIYYDQQPFHRITTWDGYLGQGGRTSIVVPGPDGSGSSSSGLNTYSEDARWLTLLSQQRTLAGNYVVTGSGDILFVKRPPQPTPKRKEKPESPMGDTGNTIETYLRNYSPCGIPSEEEVLDDPEGPAYDHLVTNEVPIAEEEEEVIPEDDGGEGEEDPPEEPPLEEPLADEEPLNVPPSVLRSAVTADELAYAVAWEGVHAFHYHKKDFFFPHESELDTYNTSTRPPYERLADHQYLGMDDGYPQIAKVVVDHRYGEVNIYLNDAYFGLKKDGEFVLRTGTGCEMRSEGGNWDVSAPGDIRLRPGRNLITMSGNDTIVKANKSIDMTSSNKDVRIAAHSNLMMLSAASGTGVMQFQSDSECILDPETENTIEPEEPPTDEPPPDDPPLEDPEALDDTAGGDPEEPEEPTLPPPTYRLGEAVVASGIVFKARRAQVTATGKEINLVAGFKKYEEPSTDEEEEPEGEEPESETSGDTDPETGEKDEKDWEWEPGRIRILAEQGQIENLANHVIDYLSDATGFGSKSATGADGKSGAYLQVYLSSQERATDEPEEPLPEELPANILAAAGTADLSSTNTCRDPSAPVDEDDGEDPPEDEEEDKKKGHPVCYDVVSVNEFRNDKSSICGQFYINQELFVGGCAYVRGKLLVFDKIEANFEPTSFDGRLAQQRQAVTAVFDEADTRCLQLLPGLMAAQAYNMFEDPTGEWLDFSFRTAEQYNTVDTFSLMENWWQHQVRVEAESSALENPEEQEGSYGSFFPPLPTGLEYWKEMSFESPYARHAATAPYPGVKYVYYDTPENDELEGVERKAKPGYGVFELKLVDEENGRPIDRDQPSEDETSDLTAYEDARLSRGTKITLGHYIAVKVERPDEVEEEEVDE